MGWRRAGRGVEFSSECQRPNPAPAPVPIGSGVPATPAHLDADYRARYRDDFRQQVAGQLDELHAMVEKLCERAASAPAHDLPEALFHVFTDMIEAEVDESIAREWIDRDSRRRRSRTIWTMRRS